MSCQCKGPCDTKRCKCYKEGKQCSIHVYITTGQVDPAEGLGSGRATRDKGDGRTAAGAAGAAIGRREARPWAGPGRKRTGGGAGNA
jgi:hypothetical protein